VLGGGRTKLRFGQSPTQGRLDVRTTFDAGAEVNLAAQAVAVGLTTGGTTIYSRTLEPGSLVANATQSSFRFQDVPSVGVARVSRMVVHRLRSSTAYTMRLRVRGVNLGALSPAVPAITLGASVGPAAFFGDHVCTPNRAATVTSCVR